MSTEYDDEKQLASMVDSMLLSSPSSSPRSKKATKKLHNSVSSSSSQDIEFSPTTTTVSSRHEDKNDSSMPYDIVVSPIKPKRLDSSFFSYSASSASSLKQQNMNSNVVVLPNRSATTTVPQVIRTLLEAGNCSLRDHQYCYDTSNKSSSSTYLYMKGSYVLQVLQRVYFLSQDTEVLAQELVAKKVLYVLSNKTGFFREALVVLAPFRCIPVLNNFCEWNPDIRNDCNSGDAARRVFESTHEDEDPMDLVLRLSRQMDQLVSADSDHNRLLQNYEFDCCQLQSITHLPSNDYERVAFCINLFNLIIRHAMILFRQGRLYHYPWPRSVREMSGFLASFGYNVGGRWYSLAELQDNLYGVSSRRRSKKLMSRPLAGGGSGWQRFWCRFANNTGNHETFYWRPILRTDVRLLFALTWACGSSPVPETIYPNRLHEGLQVAAEMYCQKNVQIVVHSDNRPPTVVLPALLGWHRKDFGTKPLNVLYTILPFLSHPQIRHMEGARQRTGRLIVEFAPERTFSWNSGLVSHHHVSSVQSSSFGTVTDSGRSEPIRQQSKLSLSDVYTTTNEHCNAGRHQNQRSTHMGTPETQDTTREDPAHFLGFNKSKHHDVEEDNSCFEAQAGVDYELDGMGDDEYIEQPVFLSDVSAITMESVDFEGPSVIQGLPGRFRM